MDENLYFLAFSISPIGPKRFRKLVDILGSAEKAWNGSEEDFKKIRVGKIGFEKFDRFRKTFDLSEYLKKQKRARVEFIPFGNKYYPEGLKKIDNPPIGLFTKGNQKLLIGSQTIAVVGA